jgi:hypothetical protein
MCNSKKFSYNPCAIGKKNSSNPCVIEINNSCNQCVTWTTSCSVCVNGKISVATHVQLPSSLCTMTQPNDTCATIKKTLRNHIATLVQLQNTQLQLMYNYLCRHYSRHNLTKNLSCNSYDFNPTFFYLFVVAHHV